MRPLFEALLDIVYPPRCVICGKLENAAACKSCERLLPEIAGNLCSYCGKPVTVARTSCLDCRNRSLYFDSARAAWKYEGGARTLIHALKYQNQKILAGKLVKYMIPLVRGADMITWVPLNRAKKWLRGYNQAELLAKCLTAQAGIKAAPTLCRIRQTSDQNKLDLKGRKLNVKNAFDLARGADVKLKNVILVDDVYTTGATVAECAKVLKKNKAARVNVITLARTILDKS